MSEQRHPDIRAESPDSLMALFQRTTATGAEPLSSAEIWRAMVDDPWVRLQVAERARKLASTNGLRDADWEDIAHEVFLLLAAKIAADPTLHANGELLPETLPGWLVTIFDHACVDVVRFLRVHQPPHQELFDQETVDHDLSALDCSADLAAAVAKLKGRERAVMLLFLAGLQRDEIAEELELSYKQVIYAMRTAAPKLKHWLAAYREDDL